MPEPYFLAVFYVVCALIAYAVLCVFPVVLEGEAHAVDVAIVTHPAYEQTTVGLREASEAIDKAIEAQLKREAEPAGGEGGEGTDGNGSGEQRENNLAGGEGGNPGEGTDGNGGGETPEEREAREQKEREEQERKDKEEREKKEREAVAVMRMRQKRLDLYTDNEDF